MPLTLTTLRCDVEGCSYTKTGEYSSGQAGWILAVHKGRAHRPPGPSRPQRLTVAEDRLDALERRCEHLQALLDTLLDHLGLEVDTGP